MTPQAYICLYSPVHCYREHYNVWLSLSWCFSCKCRLKLCQCIAQVRGKMPAPQTTVHLPHLKHGSFIASSFCSLDTSIVSGYAQQTFVWQIMESWGEHCSIFSTQLSSYCYYTSVLTYCHFVRNILCEVDQNWSGLPLIASYSFPLGGERRELREVTDKKN